MDSAALAAYLRKRAETSDGDGDTEWFDQAAEWTKDYFANVTQQHATSDDANERCAAAVDLDIEQSPMRCTKGASHDGLHVSGRGPGMVAWGDDGLGMVKG